MTRGLLLLLAVVEMALGIAGLVGATGLLVSHNAGMVLIFWPLCGHRTAGGRAAIFVRRPWITSTLRSLSDRHARHRLHRAAHGTERVDRRADPGGGDCRRAHDAALSAAAGAQLFRRIALTAAGIVS